VPPVKLVLAHRRKPGLAPELFAAYWRGRHALGLRSLPGVLRLVQSAPVPGQGPGALDGVDELSWRDEPAALEAVSGPLWPLLAAQVAAMEEPGWPHGGLAEDRVKRPRPPRGRGVKRISTVYRKPDVGGEAFDRHWDLLHAPLIARLPGLIGYVQSRVVATVEGAGPLDGLAALWFESREAAEGVMATAEGEAAWADNLLFLQRDRLRTTYVEETEPA
jgi:uncharacterized protein (TIGR02118 family)